eukprot:210779-Rhodomonas_salina.2
MVASTVAARPRALTPLDPVPNVCISPPPTGIASQPRLASTNLTASPSERPCPLKLKVESKPAEIRAGPTHVATGSETVNNKTEA